VTAITLAPVGSGGGLAIVWGLMGVAFWILLIALLVLEERYARGEITREEFLRRCRAL
jgi:hypothetical protein